jgi:hypothetical protein
MSKAKDWIAVSALVLLAGGCSNANKPTDKNFMTALNTYYQEHRDCLFPQGHQFPYEVAPGTNQKEEKKDMDALTDAGLLTRLEDRNMHVDRYTLNAAGQRYAPRFCYGYREVTGIVSSTPPGPKDGFTETAVTYHYTMHEVPVWAQTDQVKTAFPQLAQGLSDSATGTTTLANAGAGWHVPE